MESIVVTLSVVIASAYLIRQFVTGALLDDR